MTCHNGSQKNDYAGPGIENPHPFDGAADFQRPGILFLAADFDGVFDIVVYTIFRVAFELVEVAVYGMGRR